MATDVPEDCALIADREGDLYDRQPDGKWMRRLTAEVHTLRSIDSLFGPVKPVPADEVEENG